MGHVMNDAYRRFLEIGDNEKYRARKLGMITETEPCKLKPPAAKLFIGFYDPNP